MGKREVPDLWEGVEEIKYIGPFLKQALWQQNIYTCADLVDIISFFGDENQQPGIARDDVKTWLKETLRNARSLQCCSNNFKLVQTELREYEARYENEKGYNAVIGLWRAYIYENPWRLWIPVKLRGRTSDRVKYPRRCRID